MPWFQVSNWLAIASCNLKSNSCAMYCVCNSIQPAIPPCHCTCVVPEEVLKRLEMNGHVYFHVVQIPEIHAYSASCMVHGAMKQNMHGFWVSAPHRLTMSACLLLSMCMPQLKCHATP